MRSRHLSVVIHRPPAVVYAFASDPANLPRWALGIAEGSPSLEGDTLVVASADGPVRISFVPPNDFGILDHDVVPPSGPPVHVPLRVIAHPEGSEVVFTLRQLDLDDDEFDRDAGAVTADLRRLAEILES